MHNCTNVRTIFLVSPGFEPLALQHNLSVGTGFEPLPLQHDLFVGPGFNSLALIACFWPVVALAYITHPHKWSNRWHRRMKKSLIRGKKLVCMSGGPCCMGK